MSGAAKPAALGLTPLIDAARLGERWVAASDAPWLRLEVDVAGLAGRWVEITYDAGLLEPLTRPLLQFDLGERKDIAILPAPAFGRATWVGMVPEGAREVWISPTDRPGPFAFRVIEFKPASRARRVALGLQTRPGLTLLSIWSRLRLDPRRSRHRLARSTAASLSTYARWKAARGRPPEWRGFDAPPIDQSEGPHVRLLLCDAREDEAASWRRRLADQPWPKWSVVAAPGDALLASPLADLAEDDVFAVVARGDAPRPESVALIAVEAARNPCDLIYGDEEGPGGRDAPRFKPDWSPILAQSLDLVGRAWFGRVGWARRALAARPVGDAAPLSFSPGDRIAHVRRVLFSCRAQKPALEAVAAPRPAGRALLASLVIPTRDRLDLLAPCLESLISAGGAGDFEAIVVDNGSTEPATIAYLDTLTSDRRFRVVKSPGRFNFSALSNAGAAEARARTLVFLNNDIEAISSDWLELLVGWAEQPGVGAVGAKLLFADRRVQHAGVALGVGGRAAHFERWLEADDPGYFGRLNAPHETSAVTGACLAVEKAKFDAVGGFDARNLPVDLNDVDLCLRLSERGWTTLLEPRARLLHHESASRGKHAPAEERYAEEIAYFQARWLHRLRRDPYHHPALSLDWFDPALG